MKQVIYFVGMIGFVTAALTVEEHDPLAKLDTEIARSLTSDKWNNASKTFARVLWQDYRKAHLTPAKEGSTHSVSGKMPNAEQYEVYLGAFARGADAARAFLKISEDEAGRFYVKLEGHTIPAVQRNKTVVFTTGDVVYSSIPTLADKPYCTLEMYMVIRTEDDFFLGSLSGPPDEWTRLSKLKADGRSHK